MGTHLLLVGAGHAHLTILKNLNIFLTQGNKVTVISAGNYHYYSGMGPGLLSGIYSPRQIRFHVEKMVTNQGGQFIRDEVVHIDPKKQKVETVSGKKISYDVVSFNTGSYVPLPELRKSLQETNFLFPVKPIQNLLFVKNKIISLLNKKRRKVIVVGGGAAGVEIAANLRALAKNYNQELDITLIAGGSMLNRFNDKFIAMAKTILRDLHIHLLEKSSVKTVSNRNIILNTGLVLECDMVIWAIGTYPSPVFENSGLPTGPGGGLLVNEYLQSVLFPNIFGGGDCISFKNKHIERVGVYAVRQNPILFENLMNFSTEKQLSTFVPQKDFLVILNMGNGIGLLNWKNVVLKGKFAFRLKDFIDQRFMKKFQISNERG